MCGIFCAFRLGGAFNERDFRQFVGLTDVVSYRGPNAAGYLTFDWQKQKKTAPDCFTIYMGHRRLSIIDLSEAGRQPFTNGKGVWITFNGEIFNYIELRNELISKGCAFETETDTEVILKIYEEYGESGFSRFNGMWAFVLWDGPRHRVVVSRDRFSIKPLYIYRTETSFYLASEIKQLFPLVKTREINRDVMSKFLAQGIQDDSHLTFFKEVEKVKPKTNLTVDLRSGQVVETVYWDYSKGSSNTLTLSDAIGRFKDLFTDSIRIRLRSDVKVGALLSGGLDSSAITVAASRLTGGQIESFSIVSDSDIHSEHYFINLLAQKCGIINKQLRFHPGTVRNMIDTVLQKQDEPFGSLSVIAQYAIFEQIKTFTDIVVVLSGQGGDEVLMGYLKYFFFHVKDLFKTGRWLEAMKQLSLSIANRTAVSQFNLRSAKRYIPFMMQRPPNYLNLRGVPDSPWAYTTLQGRQILDIDKYSVPILAHFEDRNSMAHSLEVRHPFLDHRLVDFLVGLPVEMKLKGGWSKFLLRESMEDLPDEIRWRRDKQGFSTPEEDWLRTDLRGDILNVFNNSRLEELGIISSREWLVYYDAFLNKSSWVDHSEIVRVYMAELWVRHHF